MNTGVTDMGFPKLRNVSKRKPLGQQVFETLRMAIVRGDLAPGSRLVENRVADAMRISRTPVREALHKLEREALIKKVSHGGFEVLRATRLDIEETFGLRAVLESYAARLAAANHASGELAPLEAHIDAYQTALDTGDTEALLTINTEFHNHLYALSRSPRLIRMINGLQDRIYRFRRIILEKESLARISNEDHRRMLEMIRNRSEVAVEALVREHILRGRDAVLEDFDEGSSRRPKRRVERTTGMKGRNIRILIAKPDLDGHDRGAKVVALALRDAGMEVIYTGLHQSLDQILTAAIQESVDVIGLSIMTGAHIPICRKLFDRMAAESLTDIRVVVGGVIPKMDIARLKEMGAAGVFPGGTDFDEIVGTIRALFPPAAA